MRRKKRKPLRVVEKSRADEKSTEVLMPILETMRFEYQHEDEQYKNLDFRASLLLAAMAALLTMFTSTFNFSVVNELDTKSGVNFWISLIYMLSGMTVMVLLIITFMTSIKIIKPVNYRRVKLIRQQNIDDLRKKYSENKLDDWGVITQLIEDYAGSAAQNSDTNRNKSKIYRRTLNLLTISVFFVLFCFLIQPFI